MLGIHWEPPSNPPLCKQRDLTHRYRKGKRTFPISMPYITDIHVYPYAGISIAKRIITRPIPGYIRYESSRE